MSRRFSWGSIGEIERGESELRTHLFWGDLKGQMLRVYRLEDGLDAWQEQERNAGLLAAPSFFAFAYADGTSPRPSMAAMPELVRRITAMCYCGATIGGGASQWNREERRWMQVETHRDAYASDGRRSMSRPCPVAVSQLDSREGSGVKSKAHFWVSNGFARQSACMHRQRGHMRMGKLNMERKNNFVPFPRIRAALCL